MTEHRIVSVETARGDGQIADDTLMVHRVAVSWGYDDLAEDQLAKFLDSTGNLFDDAVAEAAKAGVELDLDTRPRPHCARHLYYPGFRGACPICQTGGFNRVYAARQLTQKDDVDGGQ